MSPVVVPVLPGPTRFRIGSCELFPRFYGYRLSTGAQRWVIGSQAGVDVVKGKVVRFDEVRGYGFIAPESGGEDVFVHANDLGSDRPFVVPGSVVEFEVEEGERGLKTSWVRLLESPMSPAERTVSAPAPRSRTSDHDDDGTCDVLSSARLSREITDALVEEVPSLTGVQIKAVRHEITKIARRHRWVEDPQPSAAG